MKRTSRQVKANVKAEQMTEDGRPMTDSVSGLQSSVSRTRPQSSVPGLLSPPSTSARSSASTSSLTSTFPPSSYIEPLNRRQIEILRKMTGERRLRIGFEITDFVTRFALAGIRYRHPEASDAEARRMLREICRT